jgi:hypothetical protein
LEYQAQLLSDRKLWFRKNMGRKSPYPEYLHRFRVPVDLQHDKDLLSQYTSGQYNFHKEEAQLNKLEKLISLGSQGNQDKISDYINKLGLSGLQRELKK